VPQRYNSRGFRRQANAFQFVVSLSLILQRCGRSCAIRQARRGNYDFDLSLGSPGRVGPVFRSRRNPVHGFFLGFKIANMGIRPIAGYDRHKPAAGFAHLGRELRPFRHGGGVPCMASQITRGLDWIPGRWSRRRARQDRPASARQKAGRCFSPRQILRPRRTERSGLEV
jgi:hypothetical protein